MLQSPPSPKKGPPNLTHLLVGSNGPIVAKKSAPSPFNIKSEIMDGVHQSIKREGKSLKSTKPCLFHYRGEKKINKPISLMK